MKRRLIVVPYFYPPFPGAGNRWYSMVRHLRGAGHSVTVVATAAFGSLADDEECGVVRVPDLRSAPLLRRILRRGDLLDGGTTEHQRSPPAYLTKILVPDAHVVAWLPPAFLAVRRLLARADVDCVVTSGPPESVHLIGLLLGRRRPAWIADFRDGWQFESLREPFPTSPQRALDAYLEERVIHRADYVVGATRPIAEDIEHRCGVDAAWVSNGWDPDEHVGNSPLASAIGDAEDLVTLVYTGTLSIRGFDPAPFLQALRIVRAEQPDLRLVVAGPLTQEDRALIAAAGVTEGIRHLGTLARDSALALQRSADALLLVTSRDRSVATSKLFEYLGAARPIVALAEGNEAERIVRATNTGVVVSPDDPDVIACALRKVASRELETVYAPRKLDQFTYPRLAEQMAEVVELAIERREESRLVRS